MGFKAIVLDMDGTLYDLYNIDNWLEDLRAENVRPFVVGSPLYDIDELNLVLDMLRRCGYRIIINSWTPMGASKDFCKEVKRTKKEWLNRVGLKVDEIHITKYGTTKADATRKYKGYQVLVDDNDLVRAGWSLGYTINPTRGDLIFQLLELVRKE